MRSLFAETPRSCSDNSTLPAAVNQGKSAASWNISATRWPPVSITPLVGVSRPEEHLIFCQTNEETFQVNHMCQRARARAGELLPQNLPINGGAARWGDRVLFTRNDRRYDLLFDVAGSRSWSECRRVLNPEATLVMVGAPKGNRLFGPLSHIARMRLAAVRSSRKVMFFIAKFNKADMMVLRELLEAGKVTPVIDRRYELSEIADAFRYMGEGHAQGKIVVSV